MSRTATVRPLVVLLATLAACDDVATAPSAPEAAQARGETRDIPADASGRSLAALRAASRVHANVRVVEGYPRSVSGQWYVDATDPVSRARTFLRTYDPLFRTSAADLDLVIRREVDRDGHGVVFQQAWRGLPLFDTSLTVMMDGASVIGTIGSLATAAPDLDPTPAITGDDAVALLAEHVGSKPIGLPSAVLGVHGSRAHDEKGASSARLAYRVGLGSTGVVGYVDAHTGRVITSWVASESLGPDDWDFDLMDALGNNAVDTWCYFWGDDDDAGDEYGLFDDYQSDTMMKDLRSFANSTWAFYLYELGRDSYDDDGSQLEVYGYASNTGGAQWAWPCNSIDFTTPFVGQDILTHEFTHGVIFQTSDLDYAHETGAINESFADVMGAFHDGNWTHGEGSPNGVNRDLSKPASWFDYDPNLTSDNGGVHKYSAIGNHAWYLMANGGLAPGRMLTPIPVSKLEQLAYETLKALPSDATYEDVAEATWAWARARVGQGWTLDEACDVRNAWATVDVTFSDLDCDGDGDVVTDFDLDGVHDGIDNCLGLANPAQNEHLPSDGLGDDCDPDDDEDGVPDVDDNCEKYNPDQADNEPTDEPGVWGDGIGDVCQDYDLDGVKDEKDNCLVEPNPDQKDVDKDGVGDACAFDADHDGVLDDDDNCTFVANPDQANHDDDGLGDACDSCPEITEEQIAYTTGLEWAGIPPKPIQKDTDHDGRGDLCDDTPAGGDVRGSLPTGLKLPAPGTGPTRIGVTVPGGRYVALDLPVCGELCPIAFDYEDIVQVVLDGLPASFGAIVVDETGKFVASDEGGDREATGRTLRFHPQGGKSYQLVLVTGPKHDEGDAFQGSITVEAATRSVRTSSEPLPTTETVVRR